MRPIDKYKRTDKRILLFLGTAIFTMLICVPVRAGEGRTVKVAFFPMESYHMYSEEEGYGGIDAAYLDALCGYTGWNVEFVDCDTWDDALHKLENREVDLVGSAQYSNERGKLFDYAALASGYTYGCLFVEEGSSLAYEDFGHMQDMRFGVVESYVRKSDLLEYLEQNGIKEPRLYEYQTAQKLREALHTGEIDVAAHSLTEVSEGQCLVGKFAYAPYYYITWKGNKQLLQELNYGIGELKTDSPALEQELKSRFFGSRRENFAAEELNLIRQGKTVKIGFYKDTRPLAFINEDGECDGIYIKILKAAQEGSGIPIEFCPIDRNVYWKDLVLSGEIDFYAGASNMSKDTDIVLTNPFMEYHAVVVSKNDYTLSEGEPPVIALTNGRAYLADGMGMEGRIIYCDSAKDCLQILKEHRADVTILNTIEYNYQSKNERFSDLIEWENYRHQSGASLAASKDADPALLGVMGKALRLVPETQKEDIVNQYMNIPYVSYGLLDYVYQGRNVIAVCCILLALFFAFWYIITYMQKKAYQMLEKKNRELHEAIQKAQKASQAKTEFLSHMSHDIRTPINGIMGMLSIAEKNEKDAARQADCRQKIRISAEHLLSLINDVLDISKLESGSVEFHMEAFHLRSLLENCAVILGGQASQRRVKLATEFLFPAEKTGGYFVGSPLHIKQILINIAGNAIKYNKPMGNVKFKCYERSAENGTAQVCFEISDTGIGMGEEFLKHIFEPFTQEEGGARTNYQGTGLGMTITKNLVDQMGGTIDVQSELGKGSVFTVVLPLEIAEPPKIQEETCMDAPAEAFGKRVLLVEDNALNQEIAKYMLEEYGLEVTVAGDGQEAVNLFAGEEPETFQMIFMDIMMPVLDGYGAAKAIRGMKRADAQTIPIIAMTANAFAEDVKAAKDAGMDDHITKPLEPGVLNCVLQKYLK